MTIIGSDEWMVGLESVAAASAVSDLSATVSVTIEQTPAGKVAWTEHYGGGTGSVSPGASKGADVVLEAKFGDFVHLLDGEASAAALFMQGRLKMSGDMASWLVLLPVLDSERVVAARTALAAITDRS
jgi:putative sterol carrier protein